MTDGKFPEDVMEQAIAWHIRLSRPDAPVDDWEEFTLWLEKDALHRRAYDRVSDMDAGLSGLQPTIHTESGAQPTSSRNTPARWKPVLAAIAALFICALLLWPQLSGPELQVVETQAGERRTITLSADTRIELNGGSRIILEQGNERLARLEQGEAVFHVRHDAQNPFIVETGRYILKDAGTVFNVARHGEGLHVAVAEGKVIFQPDTKAIGIDAGKQLHVPASGTAKLVNVAVGDIGAWREGRLNFYEAPLDIVAADIMRASGKKISVSPSLSERNFTGVLIVEKDEAQFKRQLELLLNVRVTANGEAWLLEP
ncbi:MAG: FecR domain-containing protein [Sphingobium sp.]|nr:FecR domain-containing protein [Sphingobium sp.]MCP5398967.1 FecR domain-containing protein [Sphingomonas sp.]